MSTALVLVLLAVPFIGLGALLLVVNRWGAKHDPMPPSKLEFLSTTGTQDRNRSHQD
jgi:hypothetical protein